MRQRPPIPDQIITGHLHQAYGLAIQQVDFLPLGFDYGGAVFRLTARENYTYFLKLRIGALNPISLDLPHFLHEQGLLEIIPPLTDRLGRLASRLGKYHCALYPYIEGQDGFEVPLTEEQWAAFGASLGRIHSVQLPPALQGRIPIESRAPEWRERVVRFQEMVEQRVWSDPTAVRMAELMKTHREIIRYTVERAAQLARVLESAPQKLVLCHADIHAGNLLIASDGRVYIVDWDSPVLAPRERDLMFIGAGIGGIWNTDREQVLFYRGYGAVEISQAALAYYRWERIVQDIAAFCQQILLSTQGGADREQGLVYFASQFEPGGEIETALHAERSQ